MIFIDLTPEQLAISVKEAVTFAIQEALKGQSSSDELMPRKEAAKYLSVSLPTINTWEKAGRLKAIRFGHRVYFKKSDLFKPA